MFHKLLREMLRRSEIWKCCSWSPDGSHGFRSSARMLWEHGIWFLSMSMSSMAERRHICSKKMDKGYVRLQIWLLLAAASRLSLKLLKQMGMRRAVKKRAGTNKVGHFASELQKAAVECCVSESNSMASLEKSECEQISDKPIYLARIWLDWPPIFKKKNVTNCIIVCRCDAWPVTFWCWWPHWRKTRDPLGKESNNPKAWWGKAPLCGSWIDYAKPHTLVEDMNLGKVRVVLHCLMTHCKKTSTNWQCCPRWSGNNVWLVIKMWWKGLTITMFNAVMSRWTGI